MKASGLSATPCKRGARRNTCARHMARRAHTAFARARHASRSDAQHAARTGTRPLRGKHSHA
eukprot:8536622-Prorocentrum_lima.AAC.1